MPQQNSPALLTGGNRAKAQTATGDSVPSPVAEFAAEAERRIAVYGGCAYIGDIVELNGAWLALDGAGETTGTLERV